MHKIFAHNGAGHATEVSPDVQALPAILAITAAALVLSVVIFYALRHARQQNNEEN